MYVVEVVKHARKISPREGALLGVKLLSGGILVGQMVRRTYQNGIGHVVRLFDVIIDEAADVQDLHEDVFSDDNVLIPPVRVMPHCFGQRGTGRAIFSSLNKNIGTPELGETNELVGDAMYDPASRSFVPQPEPGVEPSRDLDRSTWTIMTWVSGHASADTPLEHRDRLLIPNTAFSAINVDLFIARAFAYRNGNPLPITPSLKEAH